MKKSVNSMTDTQEFKVGDIRDFILNIVEDRVSFGGLVKFTHLKTLERMYHTPGIYSGFSAYCQKHGCTLTVIEGQSVASWADFRAFLLVEISGD